MRRVYRETFFGARRDGLPDGRILDPGPSSSKTAGVPSPEMLSKALFLEEAVADGLQATWNGGRDHDAARRPVGALC